MASSTLSQSLVKFFEYVFARSDPHWFSSDPYVDKSTITALVLQLLHSETELILKLLHMHHLRHVTGLFTNSRNVIAGRFVLLAKKHIAIG